MAENNVAFDAASARRIAEQTLASERQPRNLPPARNWYSPVAGEALSFLNNSGEEIPPHALMVLDTAEDDADPRPLIGVKKPIGDTYATYFFNGGDAVADGETGRAPLIYPLWARNEGGSAGNEYVGPSVYYGSDDWAVSTDSLLTERPIWFSSKTKTEDGISYNLVTPAAPLRRAMQIGYMSKTGIGTGAYATVTGGTAWPSTALAQRKLGFEYTSGTGIITLKFDGWFRIICAVRITSGGAHAAALCRFVTTYGTLAWQVAGASDDTGPPAGLVDNTGSVNLTARDTSGSLKLEAIAAHGSSINITAHLSIEFLGDREP